MEYTIFRILWWKETDLAPVHHSSRLLINTIYWMLCFLSRSVCQMRVGVLRPAQGDREAWSSIPVSPSLCYQNVTSLSPDLWLLLMDTGDSSAYISAARWGGSLLSHYSHLLIASAGSPGVDQHIFQCTVGNKKLCWYPSSKRDLLCFNFPRGAEYY